MNPSRLRRVGRWLVIAIAIAIAVLVARVVKSGTLTLEHAAKVLVFAIGIATVAAALDLGADELRKRSNGNSR
jgi:hypothetical protein